MTPQSSYQRNSPYQYIQPSQRGSTGGQLTLRSLIQKQQNMLQQVLDNQATHETRQKDFEDRLARLESSRSTPTSSSSDGKKKRVVTRPLTVRTYTVLSYLTCYGTLRVQAKVQSVHNALKAEEQFKPDQRLVFELFDVFIFIPSITALLPSSTKLLGTRFSWVLLVREILTIHKKSSKVTKVLLCTVVLHTLLHSCYWSSLPKPPKAMVGEPSWKGKLCG